MKAFIKKIDRYALINICLTVLFLAPTFYLLAGVKSFGDEPMTQLPFIGVTILFGCSFIFFGSLILFNLIMKRYKPTYIILGLLAFLFLFGIISIAIFPNDFVFSITKNEITSQINYSVSGEKRFIFFAQFFAMIALSFSIIDIFPKVFDDLDWTYALAFLAVLFSLFCFVYSLITEFEFYSTFIIKLFNKETDFKYVQSIFPNKNSYAVILFIGMAASLFLHQRKFKWWWIVISLFFFVNIQISFCKSFTFISPFFIVGYLLYRFILSLKDHLKRNIIAITCVTAAIVLIFSSVFIINMCIDGFLDYFAKVFILRAPGAFESRVMIWEIAVQMLNQTNWVFGLGYRNFGFALCNCLNETALDYQFAHNIAIELIGNGGIILLLGFILLFAYLILLFVKEFKNNKSLILFDIVLVACLIPIMIIESGSFILPFTMDYAFFSGLIFIPVLIKRKETNLPSLLK